MSHSRILFVLKYREVPYDCENDYSDPYSNPKHLSSGLYNSARLVVEMLVENGVTAKLVQVVDNNKIHKEIVEFAADIVIIEAFWVVPEKFDELKRACPNVIFVIRNHSDLPFVSNEGIAMEWTLEYVKRSNVIMTCNSKKMVEETRFLVAQLFPDWDDLCLDEKVVYLPNYYTVRRFERKLKEDNEILNVGCFGAIRPLKNQLLQAVAAIKLASRLGKRLHFHVNATRIEMGGNPILKNLRQLFAQHPHFKLVQHPWIPHHEFKNLVRSMDLVTQVSFSETFNIIAADAVTEGVPIVVSKEIPWASKLFVADATDSNDIADKMHRALVISDWFPNCDLNLKGLRKYNRSSEKHWMEFLERFEDVEL